MKRFTCLLLVALFALSNTSISQQRYEIYQMQNFTPDNLGAGTKIEKMSRLLGRGDFVLLNNGGVHSLALYNADPLYQWYTIPLPKSNVDVIDISSESNSGLFALYKEPSGETGISYHAGTSWSGISTGALHGNITKIFCENKACLYAVGNFVQDGRPYHVAVYQYSKKWMPLFGEDQALFENATVKKVVESNFHESLLLENNVTGKQSVVVYDESAHKWETLPDAPGPITDMAINSSPTVYICGTETTTNKPYVVRWINGKWEKLLFDATAIAKPEHLIPDIDEKGGVYVAGPAKDYPLYAMEFLPKKSWKTLSYLPPSIKSFGEYYSSGGIEAVAEENGKTIFYRSQKDSEQFPDVLASLQTPLPGYFSDMEAMARKKIANRNYDKTKAEQARVYTSVPELISSYTNEYHVKYSQLTPFKSTISAGEVTPEKLDKIIAECTDVRVSLLEHFQGKLKSMKIKDDEAALGIAFDNYMNAMGNWMKDFHDALKSTKNIIETRAREHNTTPLQKTDYSTTDREDRRKCSEAVEEVNKQLEIYNRKKKNPTPEETLIQTLRSIHLGEMNF